MPASDRVGLALPTRRGILRAAGASAGAAALGLGLSACASPNGAAGSSGTSSGSAAPAAATTGTPVSFTAMYQAGLWSPNQTQIVLDALWQATQPFRDQNPSIKLTMEPLLGSVASLDFTTGTAPDLVVGWNEFTSLTNAGFLQDLSPYVRQSNRTLDAWPTYAVDGYRVNGKLYALPFYVATTSMVTDHALLDQLGLEYPAPDWTFAQWTTLWSATTQRGGKNPRSGGGIFWSEPGIDDSYFRGWGGTIMDPAQPTHCVIDSEACIAAGEAIFPLLQQGIATKNSWTDGPGAVATGRQGTCALWNAALAVTSVVLTLARLPKWDFYPMPRMPQGSFAYTQRVFRGMNAATKAPDAAWTLLDWLCWDPTVQRVLMHYGLEPPALKSLQPEYVTILKQTIPPFAHKNLDAIIGEIVNNGAVPDALFPVASDQARTLLTTGEQGIIDRKAEVRGEFKALAQQMTALEEAHAQEEAVQAEIGTRFPTVGSTIAVVQPGL